MIADQKPALKIPPITSQELAVKSIIISIDTTGKFICFMRFIYYSSNKWLANKLIWYCNTGDWI